MITWHFKSFNELTTKELYEIIRLRIQVFVIEQNAPYQDCDRKDYVAFHLFASENEEVLAYTRLLPAGISYTEPCLGRVVTSELARGKGLGRIMLTLGLEAMETQFNTTDCRISAQLYLKEFYESYGFQQVSEVYLEDGLPHIEMLR